MKYFLCSLTLFVVVGCVSVEENSEHQRPDYDRSAWSHWIDEDRDCQNERHEVLIARSLSPVDFTNEKNCTVATGRWFDPYTGQYHDLASDVDIDHVVSLKWAHENGGASWSSELKKQFANDPANLIVTADEVNQRKGAKGPYEWVPQNAQYHCTYAKIWLTITTEYQLHLVKRHQRTLDHMLRKC